jgi:hypothetical protein
MIEVDRYQCPDCDYLVTKTQRLGFWHCYNCDQDVGSEYIRPIKRLGSIVMEKIDHYERGDDDESPTVWEAKIVDSVFGDPAYDVGSLASSLQEEEEENDVVEMKRITDGKKETAPLFPYSLEDLRYWIVKRRSGEIVKYTLSDESGIPGLPNGGRKESTSSSSSSQKWTSGYSSYSEWCKHDPGNVPTFEFKKKGDYDSMRLFIADAAGIRAHKEEFDFVIDCGDVLADLYATRGRSLLLGDKELTDKLGSYSLTGIEGPRVLKIAWLDRKAPLLHPSFWVELAKLLKGDVVTNCQGGHGRSGTTMVCLMMVLNPEYGAADAITHLRAIHCARAIESHEQHEYIDEVADYLGREADAKKVSSITNFKEAFLAMKHESAKPYQARLITK